MKTFLSLSLLTALIGGLSGAAFATEFTTIAFETGDGTGSPNLGESFSVLNDTYTASFSNFVLTSQPFIDVQWTHRFDTTVATINSPARPAYGSVIQVITGTVSRASGTGAVSFGAILSETITTALGMPYGTASQQFTFNGNIANAGDSLPFTYTLTVPFDGPLSQGFAIKDDVVFNPATGTVVRVNSISQNFAPVPEPATFAALTIGAVALLRRRRNR